MTIPAVSSRSRVAVGALGLALAASGALAAPAHAQSAGVYDFDGAARAINIDRVDYDFAADGVSATVSIPGLRRKGSVSFFASLPYSDGISEARFTILRDGRLVKKYRSVGLDSQRIPCRLGGGWNARTNIVAIKIPQRCLERFTTTDVLALEVASKLRRREDRTAAIELTRG